MAWLRAVAVVAGILATTAKTGSNFFRKKKYFKKSPFWGHVNHHQKSHSNMKIKKGTRRFIITRTTEIMVTVDNPAALFSHAGWVEMDEEACQIREHDGINPGTCTWAGMDICTNPVCLAAAEKEGEQP